MTDQVNFDDTVTLLFTDIRGFTEYTAQQGDETAIRMLRKHNEVIRSQIERLGGREVKTQGDSFMVSFTTARTAVFCAVAIQNALSEARDPETGGPIRVGIGINTGEPVHEGDDYIGGMVNVAARICAAAGAGEILVSESTRQVVGRLDGLDFADRGRHELKGVQEKQHLYSVVPSGSKVPRRSRRRLFGVGLVAGAICMLAVATLLVFVNTQGPLEDKELVFQLSSESAPTDFNYSPIDSVQFSTEGVDLFVGPGQFAAIKPHGVAARNLQVEAEVEVIEGDGYFGIQFHVGQKGYHALRVLPQRQKAWLTLAPYGPHSVEEEERLDTATIPTTSIYRLVIRCEGDTIEAWVNGESGSMQTDDDSVGIGALEFAAGSFGDPFHVRLRSLKVER